MKPDPRMFISKMVALQLLNTVFTLDLSVAQVALVKILRLPEVSLRSWNSLVMYSMAACWLRPPGNDMGRCTWAGSKRDAREAASLGLDTAGARTATAANARPYTQRGCSECQLQERVAHLYTMKTALARPALGWAAEGP